MVGNVIGRSQDRTISAPKICRENRLLEINIALQIRKDQAVNHNSIDENLGKMLKAERAHRWSYRVKMFIALLVFVATIIVVVFL